ncbi:hypothetical protein [Ferrimonas sp. YFM]|uniref:hypothetical protein n=1 Tax=Ferrimonas sp. YFM TaxID=3028878 RepID=UPI0025723238|nr:hypothetical protein [Ferrimonas sp. YFM]BDY03380.1 hypothetical protein F0521_04210 [Ferrimonas sp. YFM]
MRSWILGLALVMSCAAQAHLLKVFAYGEGGRVHGSVYFAGGGPATGASVQVLALDGSVLATLSPDENGEFVYQPEAPRDLELLVDTGDGHQVRWPVSADELQGVLPAPQPGQTVAPEAVNQQQLLSMIEQAVARQVGPLRQELQQAEDRARLSDILGGLGMIFGIAGLAMWWRGRR